MKTLIVTIAAAMMALNVAAYDPGVGPKDYCVKTKNGRTIVESNGKAMRKEITFKDGTCIKPNGTVVLTSGKTVQLKEGECVNESSVMELSESRTDRVGEQKNWENNKGYIEEFPDIDLNKTDSTKMKSLDPDIYKENPAIPEKGGKNKDSDEEPPKN